MRLLLLCLCLVGCGIESDVSNYEHSVVIPSLAPGETEIVGFTVEIPPGLLEAICLRDGGAPEICAVYH